MDKLTVETQINNLLVYARTVLVVLVFIIFDSFIFYSSLSNVFMRPEYSFFPYKGRIVFVFCELIVAALTPAGSNRIERCVHTFHGAVTADPMTCRHSMTEPALTQCQGRKSKKANLLKNRRIIEHFTQYSHGLIPYC